MKTLSSAVIFGLSVALFSTSTFSIALAGGVERGVYTPEILFEDGNYIEGSFARVNPSVIGTYIASGISNILPSYSQIAFGLKIDLSDILAVALTSYEPVGYDLAYPAAYPPQTAAMVKGRAYALVAKLKASDNFSVYGGINYVTVEGSIKNLPPLPGIGFVLDKDSDIGYIVGAAYSKPEIALRVSLTYESGTDYALTTHAPIPFPPKTITGTAEALTLHFQSGIAADTLLFGSIRHAKHSDADIILGGLINLTSFSNTTSYTLGIGRKINDKLSVSLSGSYEKGSGNPSTLNPTNGKKGARVGFKYKLTDNMDFSAGFSYIWLGDNETRPAPLFPVPAMFTDNSSLAFGTKIGFHF